MNRRNFNKTLLAAGWAASMAGPAAIAESVRKMTKIDGDIAAVTRTGGDTTIPKAALKELQAALRGVLLLPGNDAYDQTRQVWNGMIDKRPGLIVRCTGAADVIEAVNFARDFDLLVAVRGGGHSISGKSVCEGGIMIDLAPIRWCTVDPNLKIARLGAGSLLGDLDHETARHGLATPTGTVSHTGAAGLTLGGGHGRLSRQFGLTCDNVRSVDMVTADGRFVRANANENPDLYWGIRGGGGNFGVITAFDYYLHDVNPQIYGGTLMYPMKDVRKVLEFYSEYTQDTPRELATDFISLQPPGGKGFAILSFCYAGDMAEAERAIQPARNFMNPLVDQVKPMPYVKLQTSADQGTPAGKLYYNKSGLLKSLDKDFLDSIAERMAIAGEQADPAVATNILVQHLGGAIGDVPPDGTAYAHRDANYDSVAMSAWTNPEFNETNIGWLRDTYEGMEPHTIGFYSNHMVASDEPKVMRTFRDNFDRLVALKNQYDPNNLFQLNPNVRPKA